MADIAKQQPQSSPPTIYLKDYTPPDYLVDTVVLEFDLDATTTRVHSRLSMKRNPLSENQTPALQLDGDNLQLISVSLDGNQLSAGDYQLDDKKLVVPDVPAQFVLEVVTEINPQANTALEGLYLSSGLLCTQCEAEGFRRITYFPDRPDVMSRYSVTLRADRQKYPVLLANGNLIEEGSNDDGTHWARWEDPSLKPSYLFALVAGPLEYQEDNYTTMHGRDVTLRLYVESENIHKCDHAMQSLKQAMQWDEQTYGREYDLDIFMIVAVNDFNMGAMENKGLNIFNASCVLASPETATDGDYYNIQSIIGHEYFHNWSGNRVTCRDWFQLSLKEGFTVFRDQEFSADLNSRAVKRIDDVNVLRTHQFAQDAGPMAHPVRPDHYMEISNFYTVTVYNKGAEVVRMMRNFTGNSGFRKGTDLYFDRHDGQAVTTDDFIQAMEDANQIDLTQFRRWYDQAGTPELSVHGVYDSVSQCYELTVTQSCQATPNQPEKLPFHIPLAVGLIDEQGNSLPLQLKGEQQASEHSTRILPLTETRHTFSFENITSHPIPSLGRGFSAPVKINTDFDEKTLTLLLGHDSDEFNRWDAGQQLAMHTLLELINDYQSGRELSVKDSVIDAFGKTLANPHLDKALIARILMLPSESYIADQMLIVDVDAIHAAREYMRYCMAGRLRDVLIDTYRDNQDDSPYRFSASNMAQRSLKNIALSYLMTLDDRDIHMQCVEQFRQGHNMTDVMAALSLLVDVDIEERGQALADFYEQWQHDAQVVEKWFALQAGSSLPDTLSRVKALMQHPAFSLHNPNKIRSLIGRFCAGNPVRFHAADGAGYCFLADQVLSLDSINPQIAARLIQTISRWRRYDDGRQELMKQQLQGIVAKEGLSRDVYEIVSKSLE